MLGEFASHQFDMFTFLTGQTLESVAGCLAWAEPDVPELKANTAYQLVARSSDGIHVSIEHTEPPGSSERTWHTYVEGTRGYMNIESWEEGQVTMRLEEEEEPRVIAPNDEESSIAPARSGLVADIAEMIRDSTSKPLLPTFEDGRKSLEALMAVLEADRRGAWVNVSDRRAGA